MVAMVQVLTKVPPYAERQAGERQADSPAARNVLICVEEQLRQDCLSTSFYLLPPSKSCLT